jgi:hypothetical protein
MNIITKCIKILKFYYLVIFLQHCYQIGNAKYGTMIHGQGEEYEMPANNMTL